MTPDSEMLHDTDLQLAELLEEETLPPGGLEAIEVQVEQPQGRQRRLSARIQIPYSAEQIWQILTDYEQLADFIPNLSQSRRLSEANGKTRIEQVGAQSFLKLKFCARVVLDMVEQFPNALNFQMVEGDFKEFFGSWRLQPAEQGTTLEYTLTVLPPRTMPIALIERRLKQDLAVNLRAIAQRTEEVFGSSNA